MPPGWLQGRGTFGGMVLGAMVRSILDFEEQATPDAEPRPLRSLTAEIMAPVAPGLVRITVELLRRGSGVSTLRALLVQDGGAAAHAVAVLGRPRAKELSWDPIEPSWATGAPSWRELQVLPSDLGMMPAFARHFAFRNTGPVPFTSSPEALAAGWIAPRVPAANRDAAFYTAMIDTWWPAGLARLPAPRPAATLTFMLELLVGADDPEDGLVCSIDAPLYFCSRAPLARDGYTNEERRLYSADGRLLARNYQLLTFIK